jgi:hypothetical protein
MLNGKNIKKICSPRRRAVLENLIRMEIVSKAMVRTKAICIQRVNNERGD